MSVFSVHVLAKHPTVENRRLLKFPTKYHVLPPLIQYSTYNQNKNIFVHLYEYLIIPTPSRTKEIVVSMLISTLSLFATLNFNDRDT